MRQSRRPPIRYITAGVTTPPQTMETNAARIDSPQPQLESARSLARSRQGPFGARAWRACLPCRSTCEPYVSVCVRPSCPALGLTRQALAHCANVAGDLSPLAACVKESAAPSRFPNERIVFAHSRAGPLNPFGCRLNGSCCCCCSARALISRSEAGAPFSSAKLNQFERLGGIKLEWALWLGCEFKIGFARRSIWAAVRAHDLIEPREEALDLLALYQAQSHRRECLAGEPHWNESSRLELEGSHLERMEGRSPRSGPERGLKRIARAWRPSA